MKTVNFTNKSFMSWLAMAMLCIFAVNANAQVCSQGSSTVLDPETCESVILLDDLSSGAAEFFKVVLLEAGDHVKGDAIDPIVDGASVTVATPGTYKYQVDSESGCWGTFIVEDKSGPFCENIDPATGDPETDQEADERLQKKMLQVSCTDENPLAGLAILEANDFKDCTGIKEVWSVDSKISDCDLATMTAAEIAAVLNVPKRNVVLLLAKDAPAEDFVLCEILARTWYASDWDGNVSAQDKRCTQLVGVYRPTAIIIDMSVTAECGVTPATGAPFMYDIDSTKIFLNAGESVCKFAASNHADPIIYTCQDKDGCEGNELNYKQATHWTVFDWCTGAKAVGTILMDGEVLEEDVVLDEITVVTAVSDETAPVVREITAPSYWANPYDCSFEVKFEDILADDACYGEVTADFSVVIASTDAHGGATYGGSYATYTKAEALAGIKDVPAGASVTITASAWDCCGNYGTRDTTFTVTGEDTYAPICISNDELNVSLVQTDVHGSDVHTVGARVYPEDLDDTSKDNCGIASMQIRTIGDDGVAGPWSNYVEYSYNTADLVDKEDCTIIKWVDLQVTDVNGNTSVCPSKLTLRDETTPVIVAPEDISIDCLWEAKAEFGTPTIWGSCYDLTSKDTSEKFHCDIDGVTGTKTRTWTITKMTEHGMTTSSVSQTISITPADDETFTFPYDYTVECAEDNIPAASTLSDILDNRGCSEWVMNVSEKTFTGAEGACYKIIRNYEFINWCRWDENFRNDDDTINKDCADNDDDGKLIGAKGDDQVVVNYGDYYEGLESDCDGRRNNNLLRRGYFNYIQVIKVSDTVDPTGDITTKVSCDPSYVDANGNSCNQGTAEFTVTYNDECSNAEFTSFYVDGSDAFTRNGDVVSAVGLAEGSYTIHARIDDQCGNFIWATATVEVGPECKKPTPIAYATFTAVMENCQVDVWLSDIEASSSDNCELDSLAIALVVDTNNDGEINALDVDRSYFAAAGAIYKGHDVVNVTTPGLNIVALWARDAAGNTQFTLAPISAQDNAGTCSGNAGAASVIGSIVNENNENVDQVTISARGTDMVEFTSIFDGSFNVASVPMHSDVTISAEKNVGHLNGVSTADLVLLQRHVLGINNLSSAYKIIAADANNDTKIDTRDMLHISRLVLGIYDELPNNNSWRFVAKDHVFANPTSPWGFAEAVDFQNLEADAQADFIGVKIGDLSGNAVPSKLLGSDDTKVGAMTIAIDDATIAAGETATIEFTTSDFNNFAGYQFSIALDSRVEFNGVSAGTLEGVSDANFGLASLESGVITTNWSNVEGVTVENGTVMFSLTVTASQNVNVSEILSVNSAVTSAEAYNNDLDVHSVGVQFNRAASATFELFQNTPNPVSGETVIGFNLPTAGAATLKVMDVAGRTISVVSNDFAAGYNTIALNKSDLGATGVLYYQLDTENNSATKKMVILE